MFSWIEWPDKAARTAMGSQMDELMQSDDRFNPDKNPMPFDGKRMIYGGFDAIVEKGAASPNSYVQGFLIPVPEAKREAYRKMAEDAVNNAIFSAKLKKWRVLQKIKPRPAPLPAPPSAPRHSPR